MRRPYTVRDMAERAGTGDHTPPPTPPHVCASCGVPLQTGRVYCAQLACIRRGNRTGRTTEKRFDPLPTVGTYSA